MVESRQYAPERGDVIWINYSPQAGHEQGGRRPGLVVSPAEYNRIGLLLACPITTRAKNYPFEVSLPGAGRIRGVVLADQVRSLDWKERQAVFAGRVPAIIVNQVIATIDSLLK